MTRMVNVITLDIPSAIALAKACEWGQGQADSEGETALLCAWAAAFRAIAVAEISRGYLVGPAWLDVRAEVEERM